MGIGRKLCAALAVTLALAGVLGTVWGWYSRQRELRCQVKSLEDRVAALEPAQWEKQWNLAKWYNYNLEQGTPALGSFYPGILDMGDGAMALLEVPQLGQRLVIRHGARGPVGHDPDTPFPIGGRGNHTVLQLSRGYGWTEGMTVYIDCLGRRQSYRVESIQVMPESWSTERPTEAGGDYLTLVYDQGNTRTIIRCVRSQALSVLETPSSRNVRWLVLALPWLPVAAALVQKCLAKRVQRL